MSIVFIIFLIATTIQVGYFTCFLVAFLKKNSSSLSEAHPVSVIVCAHDEEQNLKELIPLLLKQQHLQFEVIIVNDRSNDGTYDYLLDATQQDNRLRMVQVGQTPQHISGKKYAITLGIKAARYDWVLLTDADCRPDTELWLHTMSARCEPDKEIVLGYSPYQKVSGLLNLFTRFETLLTGMQYIACAILGSPYMGVGRNLAYRKSLFLNNKGFNGFLSVTGGDDDLFVNQHATSKNTAICVGANSLITSIPKKTWREFFHQKVRHLSVGKRYRFKHRVVLGIFAISYLFTWLTLIPLLFVFADIFWVVGVFTLRSILFMIATHQAATRFGQKFEWWSVPLLDFVFVIYYLSTAPVALLTKKMRWKN